MSLGHGNVIARPDGVKIQCGGPSLCGMCAREEAATMATAAAGGDLGADGRLIPGVAIGMSADQLFARFLRANALDEEPYGVRLKLRRAWDDGRTRRAGSVA